jgi:hypothetical protein
MYEHGICLLMTEFEHSVCEIRSKESVLWMRKGLFEFEEQTSMPDFVEAWLMSINTAVK